MRRRRVNRSIAPSALRRNLDDACMAQKLSARRHRDPEREARVEAGFLGNGAHVVVRRLDRLAFVERINRFECRAELRARCRQTKVSLATRSTSMATPLSFGTNTP